MKSRFFAVLAVAVIGVALASPLAAQTLALRANIPFEFNVAGKAMPAGEYRLLVDAGSPVLRVSSLDSLAVAFSVGARPPAFGKPTNDARITFNRYGDTYFLSTVVNGFTGARFETSISESEHELARTASTQKYEIRAVLARR